MLFRFIARLGMDISEFVAGAKKATATSEKMKSDMASQSNAVSSSFKRIGDFAAAAFSVSTITNYARGLTDAISQIKDMSELLGLSTDEAQALQLAADKASQPFNKIVQAFQSVEQSRAKAMAGDKNASLMFAVLGIDPSKGSAKDVIKAALDASSRGVQENAAAFDLLGKNAQGLRLTLGELENMGPVKLFTQEDIDKVDAATKQLKEAKRQFDMATMPAVTTMLQGATGMLNMFNPAVDEKIQDINRRRAAGEFGHLKAVELRAATFLGMGEDENKRFGALDLQDALRSRGGRTTSEGAERLLERIAAANEATLSTLESATKQ